MTIKGLLVVLLLSDPYVLYLLVFVWLWGMRGPTLAMVELYGMCR